MEQSIAENWPIYFKDLLITKDSKNNVGVVTLWTKRQHFEALENCNTIGNLYTFDGINYLLKNLAGNRNIRYLIVCGHDLSGMGKKLVELWKGEKLNLDANISGNELEKILKTVELINLIGANEIDKVQEKINSLEKKEAYDKAIIIPESKMNVDNFPSEDSVFVVREEKIGDAWLGVLKTIMDFGLVKGTDYAIKQKEILNLITITNEDLNNLFLPEFLDITKESIEEYVPQITTNKSFEGVAYTYGQRFRSQFKIDQIEGIINDLKRNKDSRRAYATTWDPNIDSQSSSPPCIDNIQAIVRNNKLYLTVYIRTNDMYKAWPLNAFGLRYLQKIIADELHLEIGTLTTISSSAHIYENDWNRAKEKIKTYKPICKPDPRGNLVVSLENEKLKVARLSPEGVKLKVYFAENAKEMYDKLEADLAFSQTIHAVYVGSELGKAETALKNNLKYTQDIILETK